LTTIPVVALVALVCAEILLRVGVVPVSFTWADEIIELLFAWMVFLGTAIVWRTRAHIVVDLVPQLVAGTGVARLLEVVAAAFCLVFLAIFTWQGALFTVQAWGNTSPMLALPRPLWYAPMPIAGGMMIWHTLRHTVTALAALLRHRAPVGSMSARG
jgi:TRAP-type transport system small permease protein